MRRLHQGYHILRQSISHRMHRMYDWRRHLYLRDCTAGQVRCRHRRAPQERRHFDIGSSPVCYG